MGRRTNLRLAQSKPPPSQGFRGFDRQRQNLGLHRLRAAAHQEISLPITLLIRLRFGHLVTPDDEGHAKDKPEEKAFRARQNVVLELGMMLAHLGRARVAILMKSDVTMERPSDIQGLLYMPFKDDVEEAKVTLAKELDAQGIHV